MAIDKTDYKIDTTEDGVEYIAESTEIFTDTMADGTQIIGESTAIADPDDPTKIEVHGTLTEIAPDGTETVTEMITNEDGTFIVEEESAAEEFVEAFLGVEIDDNLTQVAGSPNENSEDSEYEIVDSSSEFEVEAADFTVGDEMFSPDAAAQPAAAETYEPAFDSAFGSPAVDTSYSATPFDSAPLESPFEATPIDYSATSDAGDDALDAELLDQQAHAEAAREAQESADEFVAEGDYAAAAEARETAENEAWEAGDTSMLGAYDASDLTNAAEKQEEAEYYNEQQAEYAQAGDYEAAREAAGNSAYATYEADSAAGGDDHTGQADAEYQKMDMADWEQDIADDKMANAESYAAEGDFETAAIYADSAADHQEMADDFGDMGEHGGDFAVYDPSSEVASGGSYDSTYDAGYDSSYASSYDSGMDAVDTGFDSGMDTSMDTSYDSGMDDV